MIKDELTSLIAQSIEQAQQDGVLPTFKLPDIALERPKQADHGDYATPVSLQLAGLTRMNPMVIVEIPASRMPLTTYAKHCLAEDRVFLLFARVLVCNSTSVRPYLRGSSLGWPGDASAFPPETVAELAVPADSANGRFIAGALQDQSAVEPWDGGGSAEPGAEKGQGF